MAPPAAARRFSASCSSSPRVILLNAAPEVIYQRGSRGGLETVQRSVRFLQANWIEWGIPNLLILAVWWFVPRDPLASLGLAGHDHHRAWSRARSSTW